MKSCEMILSGFGGQGILFAGKVLAAAAMRKNKMLSWLPSYGPEMRGGTANCHVKIDDAPIGSPIVTEPDVLVAMNLPSLDKFEKTVRSGGCIFVDSSLVDRKVQREDVTAIYVNSTQAADAMGMGKLANMVMLGKVIRQTGLFSPEEITKALHESLPAARAALVQPNIDAVRAGYEL